MSRRIGSNFSDEQRLSNDFIHFRSRMFLFHFDSCLSSSSSSAAVFLSLFCTARRSPCVCVTFFEKQNLAAGSPVSLQRFYSNKIPPNSAFSKTVDSKFSAVPGASSVAADQRRSQTPLPFQPCLKRHVSTSGL